MQCTPMRAQLPFPSRPSSATRSPSPFALALSLSLSRARPGHPSFSRPSFFLHPARLPPQLPLSPRFPRVFLPLCFSPRGRFSSSLSLSVYSRVCTLHSSLLAVFYLPFLPRPTTAFISFSESIDLCCNARLSLYFSLCVSLTRCISTSPTNANWKPLLRVSRHNTRVVSSSSRHFPRLSSSPSMGGQGARPRSIFRHPSPEAVRSMIRFEWIIVLSSLFSFLFG